MPRCRFQLERSSRCGNLVLNTHYLRRGTRVRSHKEGRDPAALRERSDRPRRLRSGGEGRLRVPGDAQHGDPREFRALRRGLRGVGSQRESRRRGRDRRLDGRRARPGDDEARRCERGGRPDLHRLLHRGARGPRDRHGGRPGAALLPERAGQPALRGRGEDPHARAVGLLRGEGVHAPGVRTFREVRHPRLPAHDHPDLPRQGRRPPRGAVRPRLRRRGSPPTRRSG